MRACIIIMIMSICINGCANVTTDSVVWRAQDVSLSGYQSLLVLDIFNTSGKPISNETLAYCAEQIKAQLESHGLEIVEQGAESGNTLMIKTSIIYFEFDRAVKGSYNRYGPVKESVVSMQIVMLNQSMSRTLAEIKNVTTSGAIVYKLLDREKALFHRIAEITADDIEELIRPANPQ